MIFTVECRKAGGGRESVEIEAADRAALFGELGKRGLTAIRVSEGRADARRRGGGVRKGRVVRFATHGAAAGVAVILGVVGVWWWVSHRGESVDGSPQPAAKQHTKAMPDAVPVKAVKQATEKTPTATADNKPADQRGLKTYRDERGILRYEGGARVPNQRPAAEPVGVWSNKPKIFKHSAEDSIAEVLQLEIGQPILGDFRYGESFVKSFKESLAEPVEILETDDAETVAIKKDVQATKEELKARMEAGEDVAAIMNESMDELRKLGSYRHELEVMRAEYMSEGEERTEQDYIDFTEAANAMLKEKGLPPLALPRLLKRALGKHQKGTQR